MDKILTTDCYTAIAMKGSALDLKLQKMVKKEYLEKHTSMIVLTVEEFNKVIKDAKAEELKRIRGNDRKADEWANLAK